MKLYKSFHALTRGNLIVLGLELGALYWIFESGIYAFAFQRGNFYQQIFMPDAHEIWMRGFTIFMFCIFGAITQTILAKRKRAEQALREQESREQEYLDIAGVILVVLDERGDVTLINKKGCGVLGYTDKELLGKSWFETCLPRENREEVSSVYRRLMEGELGLVEYHENPVLTAKGEERIIAWHNTILRDAFGKITGTLSSGEDITERKQAEAALQKSEEQMRLVTDAVPALISYVDRDRRFRFNNRAYEEWFNRSKEEMFGKHIKEILGESAYDKVKGYVDEVLSGKRVNFEESLTFKDAGERWVNGTYVPHIAKDGKVEGFFVLVQDVTELRQTEVALGENEKRLKVLFDNITIGVYRTTPEGQILVANLTMLKLLGFSSFEELTKRDLEEEGFEPDYPRGQFKEIMERNGEILGLESAWKKRDGSTIYVRENARAIRGEDGKILYYEGTAEDITERKQAEESLRQSEDRFRTSLENMLDGFAIFKAIRDETGRIIDFEYVYINEAGCRLNEGTRQEFLGRRLLECWPNHLATGLFDRYCHLVETGNPMEEDSLSYKDVWGGRLERKVLDIRATKLGDGFAVAWRDVGEREKMERDLRESEKRFREFADLLPQVVYETDSDGNLTYANRYAFEAFGYSQDDLDKGLRVLDMLIPEERDRARENTRRIFNGDISRGNEYTALRKDGSTFPIIIYSNPIIHAGKPVGTRGIIVDISKRKQAEVALKESETKYRSLIENSDDAIYLRVGEKFELVNPKFLKIFDVTIEDLQAPDFNYMQLVAPRSRSLLEERNRMLELGEELPSRYEFIGLKKDGKEIDLEASATHVPYRGGIAIQGILRDITERKKMEAQLRQTQKMEAIGTLAGGIAHDFNNILMAMLGYSDMARQDIPKDSPARVNLKAVFEAGERAKDLVKQILTFSRQTEHERQPMKIHPIVKEALKLLRASLPTTIEIRQDIDTNCGIILADPTQIHQIMMNLCTNAYHAMREKGGVLDVSLKNVEVDAGFVKAYPELSPGKYIRLAVSDTGCGMDKATMARIFDPFFTSKAVGEGTGMGLATVHGIVKSHEGAVTVYSEPGKGSTFNVYFPALEVETVTEIPADEPVTRGEETILLVDDEIQLAQLGQRMLEFMGYHVTVRTGSIDALEAFRATPDKFDLVITDLTMPNMTGVELAEEILRIRPNIPVILATGFSETVTPEKTRQVGISLYLNKPIILSELGKAVRQVLDKTAQEK